MSIDEKFPVLKASNHPNGKMVVFENAAHGVYDEETDKFFGEVENFIRHLPNVSDSDIASYKTYLASWNKKRLEAIGNVEKEFLDRYLWGRTSNRKLVQSYSRSWLKQYTTTTDFLKTGLAFYDLENYPEALYVFEQMEIFSKERNKLNYQAVSLIWQGHILDLMGKRDKAISIYKQVVEMNLTNEHMHSNYNLKYQLSPYAAERIKTPFTRKENGAE